MQTPAFAAEIDWLMGLPGIETTVVMCAEALPWRCHRSLIADAVVARDFGVDDLLVRPDGESSRKPHELTEFAQLQEGRVWYPKEPALFG